ncbi:hypothetical protein NY08_2934 [Rhodococcus sp. B7740]|nr:hypothetical protein NY08_2934 [Rhodococcus sp. B7740]
MIALSMPWAHTESNGLDSMGVRPWRVRPPSNTLDAMNSAAHSRSMTSR